MKKDLQKGVADLLSYSQATCELPLSRALNLKHISNVRKCGFLSLPMHARPT